MFKRITNRLWCRFGGPDNGQDLLEYALLAALIALVAFSAIAGVGTTLKTVFWDVIDVSTNAI